MCNRNVLLQQLDDAFIQSCIDSRELGYPPTGFLRMLNEYREQYHANASVQLANALIQRHEISYGLEKLIEMKRLDLSVEAIVLNGPWKRLFDDEILEQAREKLHQFGYINPPEFEEAG